MPFSFAICFTRLVYLFRFLLIFSLSVAPRHHSSLVLFELFVSMNILSELRLLFTRVVPSLSLEAETIRALGAEPRLQEQASSASRVGRCRERGMLMSRTSLSLSSCGANSAVGLAHKIHAEVLYSKKNKTATNKQNPTNKQTNNPMPLKSY